MEWLESSLDRVSRGAEMLAADDLQKFQQLIAQKLPAPVRRYPQDANMQSEVLQRRRDGNRLDGGVFERLKSWLRG